MKRMTSLIMAIILVLMMSTPVFAEDLTSESQVVNTGGARENTTDKVKASKTIEGTDIENVFDITLTVETQTNLQTLYEDPDIAVCIVMDISNTMMETFGGTKTKYQAAIESAEIFVDEFAEYTVGNQSKIGFVAFNTDGNRIAAMQSCDTTAKATTLKNKIRTNTGNIVSKYENHDSSYFKNKRYTNIEAGLKMAKDMLDACSNKNKFVIFLSDGLPTTYCTTTSATDGNYTGYTPISTEGTQNADGVFRDRIKGDYVKYGCNYSDKGAIRARQMATRLKNAGVTVYTIGAGLNSFEGSVISNVTAWNSESKVQNLSGAQLIQNQMARAFYKDISTIDNNFAKITSYSASTINNYNWEIGNYQGSYHSLTTSKLFENWLKYSIGSGQYYDSSNAAQLEEKLAQILTQLKTTIQEQASRAWVLTDPMGTNLEFIGFYNKSGSLVTSNLSGSLGSAKENTAAFSSNTIKWELQKSGYTSSGSGSSTKYTFKLKYRVRLTNEAASGFTEGTVYNTNGTTDLTYQVISNSVVSDMKTITLPIPSVKGYLGELTFDKEDQYGRAVPGAKFTLTHDTAHCSICKGNGHPVADNGNLAQKTAVSDEDGAVTFTKIPSGHKYILKETEAPAGYAPDETEYTVEVAYDEVTTDIEEGVIVDPFDEYMIKIKKIDGTSQREIVLPGAIFEVYSDAGLTTPAAHPDGTAFEPVTTGADGTASLGTVETNTTYYLKEVAAPDGYNLLTAPIVITVSSDTANIVTAITGTARLTVDMETGTAGETIIYIVKIPNNPGVELPMTGGAGTLPFTLGGALCIAAAVILYGFSLRRKERRSHNSL